MAKALKIAAVIAGVTALAFTGVGLAAGLGAAATSFGVGVSASTLFLAAGGLSLGAALLQKAPAVTSSQAERLNASVDPRASRKDALGSTALATDVRYEEWHGTNQDFCSWIICLASHAIDTVDQIWLNDELAWTSAGGPQGKFAGYFAIPHIALEAHAGYGYSFASGKWNTSHRLTGCAWLHMQFKVTGNSKKAESPFSGGPTSRMTIIGKGAKLYDPRRDSSVAGGSGPMRIDDQSTWRFTADDGAEIGENLPLQILRRLIGWRIRNPETGEMRLATGSGIPAKRIDLQSFMNAANLADEQVGRSSGGAEPRYHGAGVISEGDDPTTVLNMLCAGCCGRFRDTGGKLSLVIAHNDLAEAALDDGLNEDDVIGAFTFDPDPALEATPNIIRGRYIDPSPASLYQLIDYPEVKIPSVDGIDRVFTLDLGVVESPSQAQRIAKQVLQRKQLARSFKAPFDERAWQWPVGQVVPFTFAPLGFDRQLFRVASQEIADESANRGACVMELAWEDHAIYAWDGSDAAPVIAAPAITYDPTKNPLAQAIADLQERAAYLIVRQSVAYPLDSTSDTISIQAFDATIDDGRVLSFPAQTITGLTPGNTYIVLWDIGAQTFVAVPAPALTETASSNFVIIRQMTTANADGTYPSEPTAPGGDGGGGYGGGGCPIETAQILLANADRNGPGDMIPAGRIEAGAWVWARHEMTGAWGAYRVTFARVFESDLVATAGRPLVSPSHMWGEVGAWTQADAIGIPAGRGRVVALTVADAHTYVVVGDDGTWWPSHNKVAQEPSA